MTCRFKAGRRALFYDHRGAENQGRRPDGRAADPGNIQRAVSPGGRFVRRGCLFRSGRRGSGHPCGLPGKVVCRTGDTSIFRRRIVHIYLGRRPHRHSLPLGAGAGADLSGGSGDSGPRGRRRDRRQRNRPRGIPGERHRLGNERFGSAGIPESPRRHVAKLGRIPAGTVEPAGAGDRGGATGQPAARGAHRLVRPRGARWL